MIVRDVWWTLLHEWFVAAGVWFGVLVGWEYLLWFVLFGIDLVFVFVIWSWDC